MLKHSKKHKPLRQAFAIVLSLIMVLSNLSIIQVQAETLSDSNAIAMMDLVDETVDVAESLTTTEDDSEEESVPTSWTFSIDGGFTEKIEGTTGTIQGLYIDASASGAKFNGRENDAQVNAGTIINVPVSGSSILTLVAYSADYVSGITFNDEEAAVSDATLTYNYIGEAGTVAIKTTANTYLLSLTVTAVEEAPATEVPATEVPATEVPATEVPATEVPATEVPATEVPATEVPATEVPATEVPATEVPATEAPATEEPTSWTFSVAGGFTEKIEGTTGTIQGLYIDASASGAKFNGRENDAQVNAGTIINVPVSGNSILTLVAYSADYVSGITFNDEEATVSDATLTYNYIGEAGTVAIKVTANTYLLSLAVTAVEESGSEDETEEPLDTDKIDVWDFGAEQLDSSIYNNMLSVDEINSWFPDVAAGTTGVNIASFVSSDGQLTFNDGGSSKTHRLRTTNEALTRYDAKSKVDADNNTYNGLIYSNKSASSDVYVGLKVYAGDIVTAVVSSNGGASLINFESPSGVVESAQQYTAAAEAEVLTFYPTETGMYKFYSTTEKLVICRLYREHTASIPVSGTVTAPVGLSGYSIVFTNTANKEEIVAAVADGVYSANLNTSYTYDVSLKDANGYVITSAEQVALDKTDTAKTFDITVESVDLFNITGKVIGLPQEALANLKLGFTADTIYQPTVTMDGDTYSVQLEKGVEYTVVAEGVNDYYITGDEKVSYTAAATADITFAEKAKYAVTISPEGATAADLANATFTFTNLNEESYVYTFVGTENIALRDGVYSVKVSNSGIFVQKLTSNVKVEGSEVTKVISFDNNVTSWDFSDSAFAQAAATGEWNGLKFTNGNVNKIYLLSNAGTVSIPVNGPCQIKASACYQYSFYFEDETEASVDQKTGSTGQIDSFIYNYTGEAGTVDITVLGTSYFTSIEILDVVEYKEIITVGAEKCDYTSINEALDAVRSMVRTEDQRVTIAIQPGNYEEMLVIDVPNVTLKNASATPSIELKDKGVNIDENAVRITSYYGHGYAYYSMGTDCKWNEEILKVNKENGYLSFENPGTGTTSGSYWNATVVVGASGFEAEGIIFENSFNQYVSKKAADDVIVPLTGAKEKEDAPRASLPAGSTAVQDKAYVERAAALAIMNNCEEISFDNCKFVGRQDTLYGGVGTTAAFYDCAIYGGTDYIFGGMTAVFAKCDLVFNTSEDKNDVGYITAAQQTSGRGFLMYNCTVTSTTPGVDTASEYTSKPGYLGRPWQANTSEVVFYNTVIDAADSYWYETSPSMIMPEGWLATLGGQSALSVEYGTYEMAKDIDNSAERVSWASVLTEEKLADGSAITVENFLGEWDAFAGKDMTIVMPTDKVDNAPKEEEEGGAAASATYTFDCAVDIDATGVTDKDAITEGTTYADYFKVIGSVTMRTSTNSNDVVYVKSIELGKNSTGAIQFEVSGTADVVIEMSSTGSSNTSTVALVDASGNEIANAEGITEVTTSNKTTLTYTDLAAGTYQIVSPESSYNRGARLYTITVEQEVSVVEQTYTFDCAVDIDATGVTDKDAITEGTTYADYFKVIGSVTMRTSTNSNGVVYVKSIELGKNSTGAIQFEVSGTADVVIEMSSTGSSNTSTVALVDASGNVIANAEGITEVTTSNKTTLTYTDLAAGTYQIVSPESSYNRGARLYTITVTELSAGSTKPARAAWDSVAAPVITEAKLSENGEDIEVSFTMLIGYDGADKVEVTLKDGEGNTVDTAIVAKEGEGGTVTFTPNASGDYMISITAIREDEENKAGADKAYEGFVLPLEAPVVSGAACLGGGKVSVVWSAVDEAEKYILSAKDTDISVETEGLSAVLEGLTNGTTYIFEVVAVRGKETSEAGSIEWKVVDEEQRTWKFAAFGQGVNTSANKASGSVYNNDLVVQSTDGKGKLVPASTDGLAFYYTAIDPETENFTLSADITVDEWTYSNGQEGFGMMVADAVGTHGDSSVFWNNSYMNSVTKVEYLWDSEAGAVSDTGDKYSMRLGVGAQEKKGITAENINAIKGGDLSAFSTTMYTLDTTAAEFGLGAGNYNMVGNYTKDPGMTDLSELYTTFHLEIQRNNTGYFLSFTDAEGNVTTQKFYHGEDGDELTKIDKDNIYVGFFASRNAKISVTNVLLTTINPADDEPAEERPTTTVTPNFSMESAKIANKAEYELVYYGNADGILNIIAPDSEVLVDALEVEANTKVKVDATLVKGENTFKVTFTPDSEYRPSKYEVLSSYDAVSFNFTVVYDVNESDVIYISPEGKADAAGTKADPMDIYTAVAKAAPGQKIIMLEGIYELSRTVTIERGIDGTAEEMIYLIADSDAASRPVLDFNGNCAGMVLAGDYWYLKGFDITESAKSQKGLQISGDNNTIDQVNAYRNGNTGIQISRYMSTDSWEDWPSNNLVLNCTSYLNADPGYEDADGFAAKLTIADGNVFDGCIAAYNADDGWDLFAKIETGPIGKVVIKNCIAFKNGYDIDENGNELNAGNGNGFKMGGSSISGYHVLENSIAFANKAKGIDSNSCPDIQVINSTSFNNGSYNVALYTNDAVNTDYSATGIISYKDSNGNTEGESIKAKGTQDTTKIYNASNYFFPDGNIEGVKAAETWFVNLNTEEAINGGITRNEDGTINMNGYLELTEEAPSDAGARMTGTASEDIELNMFSDVKMDNWQYKFAKFAVENELMKGKGTDDNGNIIFDPNSNMTRAEFVQTLYNKEGKPAVEYTDKFTDVAEGQWYTNAILWAAENNIVTGKGDIFDVNGQITRQEMATILYKYATNYKGYETEGRAEFDGYTDSDSISSWAVENMKWALNYGIMKGKGEKMAPLDNATRSECATMLSNFMSAYE